MKFARLIAVWLLMLTLPLQALAGYTPSARCSDDQVVAKQHSHENPTDQHAAASHQHQDDGQLADFDGHSCCHHVFTGTAPAVSTLAPVAPRVITPRVSLLSTLFIPDLPQRPPRA